jgi:ComF family protein
MQAEYLCACCRTPFQNRWPLDERGLCLACRSGAQGFDACYSFGWYEGALRELIHLFKYGRVTPLRKPFGNMLARVLPREARFDAIVPVPLHWWRGWLRGFNQAELLAQEVAQRWGIPVVKALRRTRWTAPQADLSRAQRRRNVSGAFRAAHPDRVEGRSILLIDDVFTTGATARAGALALKRAGARRVTVLTLARRDRRMDLVSLASPEGGARFSDPHPAVMRLPDHAEP